MNFLIIPIWLLTGGFVASLVLQLFERGKNDKSQIALGLFLCFGFGAGVFSIVGYPLSDRLGGAGGHYCVSNDILHRKVVGFGHTIEEAQRVVSVLCRGVSFCSTIVCEDGVKE